MPIDINLLRVDAGKHYLLIRIWKIIPGRVLKLTDYLLVYRR